MIQFSVFSNIIHRLFRRRQASQGLSLRVQPLPDPDPAEFLAADIWSPLLPLTWPLAGKCGAVDMIDTSSTGHSQSKHKWRYRGTIS